MIIVTKESEFIYFPKSTDIEVDRLVLTSDLHLFSKDYNITPQMLQNYYKVALDMNDLEEGEYDWQLFSVDKVIESGVLRYGEQGEGDVQLEYQETYTAYDPETGEGGQYYPVDPYKGQVKKAVENGEVVADEGYDGLKKVIVDVPLRYEEGYADGHAAGETKGREEGKAEQEKADADKLTTLKATKNGTYTPDYGYRNVVVNVPSEYNDGYKEGKADGIEQGKTEQKDLLAKGSFDKNGTYHRDNGWSDITIAVPDEGSYDEGYSDGHTAGVADGAAQQKAKLTDVSISENGTYQVEDGYGRVYVDVPQEGGYDEGYTAGVEDGKAIQKGYLTSISVTKNGTYTRANGYKEVFVDVPQEGGNVQATKTITIDGNSGRMVAVSPDSGYDSMKEVGIDNQLKTEIEDFIAKCGPKEFTENGEYTITDSYHKDKWKIPVTVDVTTTKVVTISQEDYDVLTEKDNNTIYLILG